MEYAHQEHTFEPLYDQESRVLILGSFPSVKSRESQFYYGHPQNRFWKVTALVYGAEVPISIEEKKAFLHRNHIALWDVIASCDIAGSSDSSIRNVIPNDIREILTQAPIQKVFVNGGVAGKLYKKYLEELTGVQAEALPSTSPANAAWGLERLIVSWQAILTDQKKPC